MKIKKVNRYECEYCGKRNYSASAMKRHEVTCTMNPNRECRLCNEPIKATDYIHLIPQPIVSVDSMLVETVNNADEYRGVLEKLKKITDCPACILSIIRQAKIPKEHRYVLAEIGFDYKKESASYFSATRADNEACYWQ